MLSTRCSVEAIVLVAVAACTSQQAGDSSASDIQAVEQLMVDVDAAIVAGDLDSLLSFLADDFVDMPPNEPTIVGKPALRAHHGPLFEGFNLRIRHEPIETHAFGDVVIQRGAGVGEIAPKAGGEAFVLDQKYLFIFRRQGDGSFKLWRMTFNDNAPPTGAQ